MAVFPTLTPSSRTYTPGEYPHSPFAGMNGKQNRTRHSNVMLSSQLRLGFIALTEAEMLSILSHYQGQQGGFTSFTLPSAVWSGVSDTTDYQLTSYGWRYIEPPTVEDLMCGGHNVELVLETVPPEGTALAGLASMVTLNFAAGVAAAANGLSESVVIALAAGIGSAPISGLNQAISFDIEAGDAVGSTAGLNVTINTSITNGTANAANGLSQSILCGVTGGIATSTGSDPDFSSVSLLLHMDGSNGSTTFTDNSSNALVVTVSGNVQISTAQSKFGGASALFDGNSDTVNISSGATISSGDFTIELWARPSTTGDMMALGNSTANPYIFRLNNGSAGQITILLGGTYIFRNVACGISANTWYHLALCKSGTTTRLFVDGVEKGTAYSGSIGSFTINQIGGSSYHKNWFNGYIDDVRITTAARYTSNFTPPSEAFPNS